MTTDTGLTSLIYAKADYSSISTTRKKLLATDVCRNTIIVISQAENIPTLLSSTMTALGVSIATYHHVAGPGTRDHANMSRFYGYNVPKEITDFFTKQIRIQDDFGFRSTFSQFTPLWLSHIASYEDILGTLTEKKIRASLALTGDGLLLPLVGPSDRKGYSFIGFKTSPEEMDDLFPWQVHAIIQSMHIKYCLLLAKIQKQVNLTPREAEVLELMSYGKSNPEMAIILDIKASTVSGYVKTLFLKLETSDRVSTIMRARSLGLLL